ncbi:hypothetical protein FRC12_023556 [Ceratobasidium sp. 428]|nr:hypothetical protein FRC12_023556 [Ceratobasidium sp. 428]
MEAFARLTITGQFHALMVPGNAFRRQEYDGEESGEPAEGNFDSNNAATLIGPGKAVCSPLGEGFQIDFKNWDGQETGKFTCTYLGKYNLA